MLNRDLLALVRLAKWPVVRAASVGALIMMSYVAQGLLIAKILADVFAGVALLALWPVALAVLSIVLTRAALLLVRQRIQQRTAHEMKLRLRTRMYEHLRSLGPAYLASRRTGDVQAMLVDGVEGMEAYASKYLPQFLVCVVGPIPLIIGIAAISPIAALTIVVSILGVLVIPRLWSTLLARRGREHWDSYAALTADYVDAMQGMTTLKAFSAESSRRQVLEGAADRLYRDTMSQLKVSLVSPGVVAFGTISGASLAAIIAANEVVAGGMSTFGMFAILLLARECFRPFAELAGYWHAGYLGISAAPGIARYLNETPRRGVRLEQNAAHVGADQRSPLAIQIDKVSYRYPDAREDAIDRLSIDVPAGSTVAIVGASGAGKSTVVGLLTGVLAPDAGTVRVFGTDLRQLTPRAVAEVVSVVWQDTYLFYGTIADNLRMAAPHASDADMARAVELAGLSETVAALPEGLGTEVGERGAQLSGGQRQRVAIARALLADTSIVILDEATSAVDAEREGHIAEALRTLASGRTSIVIAHRLSTVRDADVIVVLDRGAVIERGTHAELAAAQGKYAELIADSQVLA